jgi:hypothetical protein
MSIDPRLRESYRQALRLWQAAAYEANSTRQKLSTAHTEQDNVYLMTNHEAQLMQKEHEAFQRLYNCAIRL